MEQNTTSSSFRATVPALVPWAPVFMGIGIFIYFDLLTEPTYWVGASAVIGCASLWLYLRRTSSEGGLIMLAALGIALGFVLAQVRTHMAYTPQITRSLWNVTVQGTIKTLENHPKGARIVLTNVTHDQHETLKDIRLFVRHGLTQTLGDRIQTRAALMPLSGPLVPGGFDFRQKGYFQGLSATGFVTGEIALISQHEVDFFEKLRFAITQKIHSVLPGQTGVVVAALMTGDRSGLSPQVRDAFADAGTAHILAISGLHLNLFGGAIFLFLSGIFLLLPWGWSQRWGRHIAASIGLLSALGYLLISGMSIPTQRAFVMFAIVMGAVFVERRPISMHSVALAALAVLIWHPESLLSISFQLSFAAVIALVAVYRQLSQWLPRFDGFVFKIVGGFLGICVSSVIASLATTPFTLYHFQKFTLQAVLANLLSLPLLSFWIMPMIILAFALMPFGAATWALTQVGRGVDLLIEIAQKVAALPGAHIYVTKPPLWAMTFIVLSGLFWILWQGRYRHIFLIPLSIGFVGLFFGGRPDAFVSQDGRLFGIVMQDKLYLSHPNRHKFESEQWARVAGIPPTHRLPLKEVAGENFLGHPFKIYGKKMTLLTKEAKLEALCHGDFVLSLDKHPGHDARQCSQRVAADGGVYLDGYLLRRMGAVTLSLADTHITLQKTKDLTGKRPWTDN